MEFLASCSLPSLPIFVWETVKPCTETVKPCTETQFTVNIEFQAKPNKSHNVRNLLDK